jgi:MFS family permease
LRHPDFLKLWTGETISVFGSRMGDVAVSFAAVISLGATPFQMSMLSSARIVPALAFSLFAGVWVDRLRRRPLLIAADIGRFILLATIPAAALVGVLGFPQLYAVILAVAVLDILFQVAYRAYLPSLVSREDLADANSKMSASFAAAEVGGFGLSGWLVQLLTAPFAILIDAISFLASAVAIAAIGTTEDAMPPRSHRIGMIREIGEGARAFRSDPRLMALAAASALGAISYNLFSTLYMLYVVKTLGFNPGVLGMIFAVGGVSSLTTALIATRTIDRVGIGRIIAIALPLEGLAWMLVPMAHGTTTVAAMLLIGQQLLGDSTGTIYQIATTTLVQTIADRKVIGRVNATISFLGLASTLIGILLAGVLGELVGLRPTMFAGSIGLIGAGVMLAFSPIWSLRSVDQATDFASTAANVAER